MTTEILVKKVNVEMLREQRDTLLDILDCLPISGLQEVHLEGLVQLLDEMLDIAEGIEL